MANRFDWPKRVKVAGVEQKYWLGSRGLTVEIVLEGGSKYVTLMAEDVRKLLGRVGNSQSECVLILRQALAHWDDIAAREQAAREDWEAT